MDVSFIELEENHGTNTVALVHSEPSMPVINELNEKAPTRNSCNDSHPEEDIQVRNCDETDSRHSQMKKPRAVMRSMTVRGLECMYT